MLDLKKLIAKGLERISFMSVESAEVIVNLAANGNVTAQIPAPTNCTPVALVGIYYTNWQGSVMAYKQWFEIGDTYAEISLHNGTGTARNGIKVTAIFLCVGG